MSQRADKCFQRSYAGGSIHMLSHWHGTRPQGGSSYATTCEHNKVCEDNKGINMQWSPSDVKLWRARQVTLMLPTIQRASLVPLTEAQWDIIYLHASESCPFLYIKPVLKGDNIFLKVSPYAVITLYPYKMAWKIWDIILHFYGCFRSHCISSLSSLLTPSYCTRLWQRVQVFRMVKLCWWLSTKSDGGKGLDANRRYTCTEGGRFWQIPNPAGDLRLPTCSVPEVYPVLLEQHLGGLWGCSRRQRSPSQLKGIPLLITLDITAGPISFLNHRQRKGKISKKCEIQSYNLLYSCSSFPSLPQLTSGGL